ESKNPDESTIFQMYSHFASANEIAALRKRFLDGGMGYGEAKTILFDKIDSILSEPRKKYEHLMANPSEIDTILNQGAERARVVAARTLTKVKKKMLG
ncbi:MAG: tryptophan--tRNA ligase, partial [Alphaproteobacteria bacterium]|nr:tryptophan--tRNA ligase [Alphaproteobacteria bacterium]